MQDFPIDELAPHLKSTRRKSVHESAKQHLISIITFLQDHAMVKRTIYTPGQQLEDTFGFWRSDLTDEGFEFIRRCYYRWLGTIDRGRSPTDVSMLERELKKLREEKPPKGTRSPRGKTDGRE